MSGTVEQWSPSIGEWYEAHGLLVVACKIIATSMAIRKF
jgi:hypothetical protein